MSVSVSLPDEVRGNASRADEMIRAMAEGRNPYEAAPPPAPAQPPGAVQNDVPVPAAPEPAQPAPQATLEPTPAPAAPPPSPAEDMAALKARMAALEQQANTWRGRYEAELPREREARRALEAEIADLQQKIADSQVPKESLEAPKPEELEQYGEDLFKLAARYIMPQVKAMVAAEMARLSSRLDGVASTMTEATTTAKQREEIAFFAALDSQLPNWRTIDEEPEFGRWLDTIDPIFQQPRRIALDSAGKARNVAAAIGLFKAFLAESGRAEPQTAVQNPAGSAAGASGTGGNPTAPAAPTEQPPALSLADLAAPGRPAQAPAAAPPPQPGQRVWKYSEIRALYAQRSRGTYRGTAADWDRTEREIAAAQREGRVDMAA